MTGTSASSMFESLRAHILRSAPISDAEFGRLSHLFGVRRLRKRDHLYRQGAVCDVVGFIARGCVRNYHIEEDGSEYIVNFAFEDWWVSDLQSLYHQIPSEFNVEALEPSDLLVASAGEFTTAVEQIPAFGAFYRQKIARAYTASAMRLVSDRAASAEARYAKMAAETPWIIERVPQRHLASFLGVEPQSLSRIRQRLGLTK